jgi:hypothetical protein
VLSLLGAGVRGSPAIQLGAQLGRNFFGGGGLRLRTRLYSRHAGCRGSVRRRYSRPRHRHFFLGNRQSISRRGFCCCYRCCCRCCCFGSYR